MPLTLTGSTPRDYSTGYGGIPTVADPLESLRRTLTGNLGSLGDLYQLATGASEASAAGARTQLSANLPLATQLLGQRSQNILSNLQGQISPGLTNMLGQIAAERGVGFGPDSPSTTAAYLAATGRSIENLQNLGQQQLATAIGTTPMGPQFNPMQFMLNPADLQNWQMYANTLAAAPVPSAAAAAAEAAARRGMQAGAGAVPGAPRSRYPIPTFEQPRSTGSWGGPGTISGSSLGTGTMYGGVPYYGGSTPSTAYSNWYDWLSGLPTSGTGATGGGFSYSGDPNDFYTYYGFGPEEWGSVGGTWENLPGGTDLFSEWESEMFGPDLTDLYPDVGQSTWDIFGITP